MSVSREDREAWRQQAERAAVMRMGGSMPTRLLALIADLDAVEQERDELAERVVPTHEANVILLKATARADRERDEALARVRAHDGFGGGPGCHESAAAGQARAERAEAALGRAWDDGNAVGLDGWVGPGRGTEPDAEGIRLRERFLRAALADPRAEGTSGEAGR